MKTQSILIVLLLALWGCSNTENKADAYGNFEAIEVNLSPTMPGKLIYLNLNEGEVLKENQLVAVVDTSALYINKNGLRAKQEAILTKLPVVNSQVLVFEEQVNVLTKERNRVKKLIAGNAATSKQLDDINGQIKIIEQQKNATLSQLNGIKKEANAIDFQVDAINEQINQCKVFAPIEGSVLLKAAEQGEVVNPGKVLGKIANTGKLILRVYFSGDQLNNFKIGDNVSVKYDDSKTENTTTEGKIIWVADKAEFTPKIIQTKSERVNLVYAAKIEVENKGQLKIGMPGEVYLTSK